MSISSLSLTLQEMQTHEQKAEGRGEWPRGPTSMWVRKTVASGCGRAGAPGVRKKR